MEPLNGYLHVKPLKQGLISSTEGNEYEVVGNCPYHADPMIPSLNVGEIVIVEDNLVVRVNVAGEEKYFVREDNILARIPCETGNDST